MKPWMLAIALVLGLLSGCASSPPAAQAVPWQDEAFGWQPALVQVGRDELFRLDPELQQLARQATWPGASTARRVDELLKLILGADRKGFEYAAGHSTPAAETWRLRRGDCLSLTVLTYAVARAAGLDAQVQEVRAPAVYDRRGDIEHVNRHVNVAFAVQARGPNELASQGSNYIVIDFEPQYATGFRGRPLDEDGVVARYYNNIGVERMTQGHRDAAYAHFKAAIAADAGYAPAYGNLAVLYRRHGLHADAERLLRQAIALGPEPEVPLAGLHQLLLDQGRPAEARAVAEQLRQYQEGDPYYWIAQGLRQLGQGQSRSAIAALERARDISAGFGEVHRYLALAYWRLGDAPRAREQLALMARLDAGGVMTAQLKRKFNDAR